MKNPFSVQTVDGTPRFCKEGLPVFPLLFWQTEIEEPEAEFFSAVGVEIFTCFRSGQYYEHPYWTGENEYDFSWYDEKIGAFFRKCPDKYLIPRIFVDAPRWWMEKHPDESGDGTPRESFASELWKKEQGEAFRKMIRHLKDGPYGDRIIGIHVAGGHCGEWHPFLSTLQADGGKTMAARYGKPVPPCMEDRPPAYYEAFYSAGSDAAEHFCRIVKEEAPDALTLLFFGYFSGSYYSAMFRQNGLIRLLDSPWVDIISSPHDYLRRVPGMDGYFRAYPATLARHGKLFIDEADDRPPLGKRTYLGNRIIADTAFEAVNMMRREFGNALTHNIGLWYMDIDGGMFRDPVYHREVSRAVLWGRRALELPVRRVSEVAILADDTGAYWHPDRKNIHRNLAEGAERVGQFPEFCHTGAPFDLYLADDVTEEVLSPYRVIVVLDGIALSDRVRAVLKSLQNRSRTFLWFYGAGSVRRGSSEYDPAAMEELTGIRFTRTESQKMPDRGAWDADCDGTMSPGFLPLRAEADFGNWKSCYFGIPDVPAEKLRSILRESGVFLYSDSGDVLSVSESALMVHGSCPGLKKIRLPKPKTVTSMITGRVLGEHVWEFEFPLNFGETALFELR